MIASLPSPHLSDEQLDDYVDGVLEPSALDAARVHLGECARCASRLEELRALLALSTAERGAVEPPAELWPLIVASTVAWPQLRRRVLRSLRVPLAALAIALVLLSVATTIWVMGRMRADSPTASQQREPVPTTARPVPGSAPLAPTAPRAPRPGS